MKYITEFFNFSKRKKSEVDDYTGEGDGKYPEHLKELDRLNGDTYCILTQEQVDKGEKFDEPISVVKNGYHFFYKNVSELEELENKYPVGGKYKNETILQTHILNSKNINF
jgi:hypothetical protein